MLTTAVRTYVALTATVALLLLATPAAAHIMLMPGEVAPGERVDTELLVVHGCGPGGTVPPSDDDVYATVAVTLQVPDPLVVVPDDTAGWQVTTGRVSADTTEIRWKTDDGTGVTEPDYLGVTLDASAVVEETELWLPAVQDCVDDEQLRWALPGWEERDGQLPAVQADVTLDPGADGSGTPGGWPTWLLTVVAVAVAAGAAAAVAAFTGRTR